MPDAKTQSRNEMFFDCVFCNYIGKRETTDSEKYTDSYDIDFEQMNSTHSHNIDMDAGESIRVKIIRKSGEISVQIYNEDNQLVYKGDDVTDAEFEMQINEKGTYQLYVSGKKQKGMLFFRDVWRKRILSNFVIYLTGNR